ncbi:hypothetical protein niasHT_035515 [Heterodera trifolii]|uniref:Uncharacterized protein n=1 Tax=Heterodera trifolii TaxID=157864 RepID=A0ABD2IQ48_9BILA
MSNSLMDAFEEYVQNVNFAFGSGGESPNHGNDQIVPMAENDQNVPPVEQQEQAPVPGNGNENGALQQGQMRGQFRGVWRGRVKNRGTVRGGGRPWNGTAAFCHCVECRRPKGWHGRGGGRGGAGPSGFGHGGRGGRGGFSNGQHQHMGHMRR